MKRLLRNLAIWTFHLGFVRPIVYWVAGARYRRGGLLPRGPCLVVANHNSHLDAAVLMSLFPWRRLPRVHPVAAADYFGASPIRRTFAMLLMNGIPIERKATKGDPLAPAVKMLQQGDSLILFPEGSRGEAGVVSRFRPGVGRLVRQVPGLLVVPVFLSGPERIWPRGQVLPVPLNVDAIVGKPRDYSREGDPKAIAEQVQRDVLSLAPPRPPAPGPPPSPPLRVAFCGLDGEARADLVRRTTERLGHGERTMGMTDPVVMADEDGLRETTAPIPFPRGRPWLGFLAWLFRTGGGFKGDKFVKMVERAQVDEALGAGRSVRYVVTDGSALVDLLAWAEADFYQGRFDENEMNHLMQYLAGEKKIRLGSWWKFIRKAPEVWLVNVLDLAHPPVPDVLVNLSLPAPKLMQRLLSRGEELAPHENEELIGRLQEGYRAVGAVLGKRRRVQLFEFDISEVDADTIVDEVEAICRRLIRSGAAVG